MHYSNYYLILYNLCSLILLIFFSWFRGGNGSHAWYDRINIDCRSERIVGMVTSGTELGLLQIPHKKLG